MSGPVDLKEFVTGFLLEAEEYLDSVNRNLVAVSESLKQNRPEPRAVRELFRSLHTIKGLSSMVGAEPIVAISHEMENILRAADRAGGRLSESMLDLLVQGTRAIEERVRSISKGGIGAAAAAPKALVEALALSQNTEIQSNAKKNIELCLPADILRLLSPSDREQMLQALDMKKRVVLVEFQPSPERSAQGFNITSVRERLAKHGDVVKVVPRSAADSPTGIVFSILLVTVANDQDLAEAAGVEASALVSVALESSAEVDQTSDVEIGASPDSLDAQALHFEEWTPTDHASIRVDVRRLDDALERLSELVVTRAKLNRAAAQLGERGVDIRELSTVLAENTRQLKRLRASITQARMVPIAELLQRLPLVVRGLTKDSEKSVNLVMKVGSAEVDKAVADKIFPAIVHLIRNAVDHAVETRAERAQHGKSETATITVVCDDSSGTNLKLTMTDDGRGIDREAVAKKAGLAIAKNDEELLEQIATPGLSTREAVTTTSGRGMGMDIVKRTIELLGGELVLATKRGKGTVFTLQVPVSVTIVDVLSFVSSGQIFVVPISMVDEILEIEASQLFKSPTPNQSGLEPYLIQRRGEAIPFLPLSAILNRAREAEIPRKALVVNQRRGGTIAFGVDRMLGQQEVVVRPLDDSLVRVRGMAGATDMGDGKPTLVLDLATLGANVNQTGLGAMLGATV